MSIGTPPETPNLRAADPATGAPSPTFDKEANRAIATILDASDSFERLLC